MRKLLVALPAVVATLAASATARAWGVHAGDTIGNKDNMVYAEAGWPGISAGFAHGINDKLEIGGRLDFLYGFEGTPHAFFGFGFGATIRYTLLRREDFALEAHILPGFRFDRTDKPTEFGLAFPIGVEGGYKINRQAIVSLGFDLGLFGAFTTPGYFCFAPMGGPGFEYHLTDHVTFGLVTRFGGAVFTGVNGPGDPSDFAFRIQGFFGYRI